MKIPRRSLLIQLFVQIEHQSDTIRRSTVTNAFIVMVCLEHLTLSGQIFTSLTDKP